MRSYISSDIKTPHRFCVTIDDSNIEEYHTIMNLNKNNNNISYKVTSVKKEEEDDKIHEEYVQSELVEPIPALISYIQDKYSEDVRESLSCEFQKKS